jgi:Transposase DDE domain
MPTSHGGFEQSYNAQAAVDTRTMLVVAPQVSQAPNDKRELTPIPDKVAALPQALGQISTLLADSGYFSAANVNACEARFIEPMLSMKRESHHIPLLERFAADAPVPESDDPVAKMAHRLGTKKGRLLYGLRKQTVEPVFGIIKRVMGWSQMSMRGLNKARGEWCAYQEPHHDTAAPADAPRHGHSQSRRQHPAGLRPAGQRVCGPDRELRIVEHYA